MLFASDDATHQQPNWFEFVPSRFLPFTALQHQSCHRWPIETCREKDTTAGICLVIGVQALGGLGEQLAAEMATVVATICYAGAASYLPLATLPIISFKVTR